METLSFDRITAATSHALAFEHRQQTVLVDALEHLPRVALEIDPRLVSQPCGRRRGEAVAHQPERPFETIGKLQSDRVDLGEKLLRHRFDGGVVYAAQPGHLLCKGELHIVRQTAQRHLDPFGDEKPNDHRRLLRPCQGLNGSRSRPMSRAAARGAAAGPAGLQGKAGQNPRASVRAGVTGPEALPDAG